MYMLNCLLIFMFLFVGVAFYVLLERKVLGYIQLRSGPSSVGFFGLFQPFSDAISLFSSESYFIYFGNFFIYYVVPLFGLVLTCCLWLLYPLFENFMSYSLGLLFFLCCSGLSVYFIMLAGWSSNSIYSLIGSIRSVAQSISYEVNLFFIILVFILIVGSLNLIDLYWVQSYCWFILLGFPLFLIFFSCVLAETNRSPFDLAEGESELVSGFNIEYSSFSFSFIFLSEYLSMMFMSMMVSLIFLGGNYFNMSFFFSVVFISFMFVWVRGSFPRFRYDKLMYLSWKCFLPVVINYYLFFMILILFMFFIYFSKS
uniref:NADH-ubiquinone oxidoreductase chain 1 n=1 Tax=Iolania perkinsi TaxID=2831208 RepID=A0A8K1MCZ1_9HEMI|nr:NADH dehydrogenase subunit 1 [Iolania perkinsi]